MSKTGLPGLLERGRLKGFAQRNPAKRASGTLWPHGEWSYGYASTRPDGGDWHEDVYAGMGVDDTPTAREAAQEALASLDLSDVPKSCKWPRRGTKGMSSLGQQMIKAAGHLMQEKWPRHRKTLGTITLPPMSAAARREVVEMWPLLTRELLTWLSRRLRRQGLPQAILSVTEIQPKRLARSGEGSLHWHLLWLNVPAKSGHWSVCPTDLSAWLDGLLRRHCPSYDGGYVNVDTKRVEGVVAAYMAKYMSKGRQMVAEAMEDWGYGLCPRTWWNMTKPARDMVKAATHKGFDVGELLESVLEHAFLTDIDMHYEFLRHIELDFDGVRVTVGYRGRLVPHLSIELRAMLNC
jgi:hypothetical protein